MKSITANYVDIIGRQIFPAEILYSHTICKINKLADVVDLSLPYCMPGFVDSHVHIESSMLNPQNFGRMVLSFGTIAVVCDPHEIANVLGRKGVEFMMNDAQKSPLKFYFALPSCVPSTPFETNGAYFDAEDIDSLMHRCVALAELMNYPGLVAGDPAVVKRVQVAKKHHRPIDGHIPGVSGDILRKYASYGISTDHECYELSEALEKISLGMKILIRDGSAARNLDQLFPLFKSHLDDIMVCTDDAHPDDILKRGHINKFFDYAIERGVSIFDVYKPLLLNPIRHYKLKCGRLQIGDRADFIISSSLTHIDIQSVVVEGKTIISDGNFLYKTTHVDKPNKFIDREFSEKDFTVFAPTNNPTVRLIEIIPHQLITNCRFWQTTFSKGDILKPDSSQDIAKIAVVNRYDQAPAINGFISKSGLRAGAIASSIAHDSHNVIIIGADEKSMSIAAREIFKIKGGLVVVLPNGHTKSLKLPIAGLMCNKDWQVVSRQYSRLIDVARRFTATTLDQPFMTMAFLSLQVIPSIKIGDLGLFDVDNFCFTDLFVDNQ